MPVKNYVSTFRLTPITVGNRTFAKWWADFNVTAGAKRRWPRRSATACSLPGSKRRKEARAVLRIIRAKLPNSKLECVAMKLGFNLLLWTTHVVDEHTPLFDRLKATGYDGVEIPLFEGGVSHYQRLGRIVKDAGLAASAVTVLPTGKSAIAAEAAQRALALDHLKWAIDCATALGANVLCGPFHQPLGEFSGIGPTEAEKSHCVEVHKRAAQYAARSDIELSVEPLNSFECY